MLAKRRSLEQWAEIIDTMQASGLPQNKWCETNDIRWQTLNSARVRLEKSGRTSSSRGTSADSNSNDAVSIKDASTRFVCVKEAGDSSYVTVACGGISFRTTPCDAAAIFKYLAGEAAC